jgi:CRP/FNR family cyclic AMP-dependent transcriptional regulator
MRQGGGRHHLVNLLDEDPDLAVGLDDTERALARASLVGIVDTVSVGAWDAQADGDHFGALILDGLLLREMVVAGRESGELLGAGDVLLPRGVDQVTFVPRPISWRALDRLRLVWLGSAVLAGGVRWPSVARTILQRSERRVARVLAMQSRAHLPRVEDRLVGVLWLLAERWGRVSGEGMVLPLDLTHRTLGQLIGAQRQSVTGAVGALEKEGRLKRRSGGGLLLPQTPPRFLDAAAEGQLDGVAAAGGVG